MFLKVWGVVMTLSSSERRRRVRRAVKAEKKFDAARRYPSAGEGYGTEGAYYERTYHAAHYGEGQSLLQGGYGGGRRHGAGRRSRRRGRRRPPFGPILLILLIVVVLAGLVFGGSRLLRHLSAGNGGKSGGTEGPGQAGTATSSDALKQGASKDSVGNGEASDGGAAEDGAEGASTAQEGAEAMTPTEAKLAEAKRLAAQYDYDAALTLLGEDRALASEPEVQAAVASYEEAKGKLQAQDISQVTHVFFHSLVVDPENAFDKEKWGKQADGYNKVMTTISEFEKMLDQFYADGFVLVSLHDLASMQQQADGSMKMTPGEILLPEGKKAMVMSQDDVCYYEYMKGAGFADRIILDEEGKPTCHYTDKNGQEFVGDYDLVPILDRFVEEHPDFSYRGAKACLAFTGYNGILGYRTDETYDPNSPMFDSSKTPNENIEADRETARKVARALREDGYELASHSWGHRDLGNISFERMKKDTDRWDKNVNQALLDGTCDIILYPFGADVGDWHPYSHDNERFQYLFDKGFRYFCNVDSTQHWVQRGDDWLRQGRRNLDGDAMWQDIANGKNRLSDLFPDVSAIFDKTRPTPVPNG